MNFTINVVHKGKKRLDTEGLQLPSLRHPVKKDAFSNITPYYKYDQIPMFAETILNKIAKKLPVFHYGSFEAKTPSKLRKRSVQRLTHICDSTCSSSQKSKEKKLHKVQSLPFILKPLKLPEDIFVSHQQKKSLHEIATYYENFPKHILQPINT
jgi:hypothetical protein